MASDGPIIRLCEWGCVTPDGLSGEPRDAIEQAARRWKNDNRLNALPLTFEGASGKTLRARQWVGVVEAGGVTVEIYPKLDAALLGRGDDAVLSGDEARPVLKSLLWMLSHTGEIDVPDADTANLPDDLNTFLDLWAHLLARNLRAELMRGAARAYEANEGDLSFVRGRIDFRRQVGLLANRMDKIACRWDEFNCDTPLNRLLLCACRTLLPHVRHRATRDLLSDCAALLDEVTDVVPSVALRETALLAGGAGWARATERFRRVFHLAHRLLRQTGHALGAGQADTFVFLLDMNRLFEKFARAALEAHFAVSVETQAQIGYLLPNLQKGRILQKPDFRFKTATTVYLGDAKYKHLAKGQDQPLTFAALPDVEEREEMAHTPAGRVLSPDDVRQVGVYADLQRKQTSALNTRLLLLYPWLGQGTFDKSAATATLWNGVPLTLLPVRINHEKELSAAIPGNGTDWQ